MGEFPRFEQGFPAFGWVFNDIDDVAQVNDIGRDEGIVGLIVRVPTGTRVTLVNRAINIATVTSAVVEKGGIFS